MVEPIVGWSPERLRFIGMAAAIAGGAMLTIIPLSKFGLLPWQRVTLAISLAVSSYYSIIQLPIFTTVITIGSVGLAVGIPLLLSLKVVRETVKN